MSCFLKSNPGLPQDIAYIYEILHCNHIIILSNMSNATAYGSYAVGHM